MPPLMDDRVLGVLAGGGRLPVLIAAGMKTAGRRVCGVGFRDHYDAELPSYCDFFEVTGALRIGRWIKALRRHGAAEAVLVGRVSKARMHDPLRFLRQMPDWRTAQVWYQRLSDDRRSSRILTAVADVLEEAGITLIDSTTYITDHLAHSGLMTAIPLPPKSETDIAHGWRVLRRTAQIDIGQSLAVNDGRIIAMESLEGTDGMIERTGRLNGQRGWSLLKTHKDDHDMRFDVPTIGTRTIERLSAAGARCVALRSGGVIMVDKPEVINAAQQAGISIVGLEGERGTKARRHEGTK